MSNDLTINNGVTKTLKKAIEKDGITLVLPNIKINDDGTYSYINVPVAISSAEELQKLLDTYQTLLDDLPTKFSVEIPNLFKKILVKAIKTLNKDTIKKFNWELATPYHTEEQVKNEDASSVLRTIDRVVRAYSGQRALDISANIKVETLESNYTKKSSLKDLKGGKNEPIQEYCLFPKISEYGTELRKRSDVKNQFQISLQVIPKNEVEELINNLIENEQDNNVKAALVRLLDLSEELARVYQNNSNEAARIVEEISRLSIDLFGADLNTKYNKKRDFRNLDAEDDKPSEKKGPVAPENDDVVWIVDIAPGVDFEQNGGRNGMKIKVVAPENPKVEIDANGNIISKTVVAKNPDEQEPANN